MSNIFKVYPERPISGVLPNMKRIVDPIELELNEAEFIRCINYGNVYAIVENKEIKIDKIDYRYALSLFELGNDIAVNAKSENINISDKDNSLEINNEIDKEELSDAHADDKQICDKNSDTTEEVKDSDKSEDYNKKNEVEHKNNQMNRNQSSSNRNNNRGSRRNR